VEFRPAPVTPPETSDLLLNLGFLLKDVARLCSRNFERHASGVGLTLDQCKVLCHLQRNEASRRPAWPSTPTPTP
jgi:hypothetical protein